MRTRDNSNTLPVDRGWAWAVCAGGCIVYGLLQVSSKTTSILYVELLEKYDTPITKRSLLYLCHILAFSFSSAIITNFILPRLGERRTVVLGGLLSFVGAVGASMAPSIEVLTTALTIKGVAAGLAFAPSLTLLRVYFKKRRSVASSAPFCAGSAASIIFPYLIRAVRKEYGISNTYLIMAAVELHICFGGLLLRPASAYKYLPEDTEEPAEDDGESTEKVKTSANGTKESTKDSSLETKHIKEDESEHGDKYDLEMEVVRNRPDDSDTVQVNGKDHVTDREVRDSLLRQISHLDRRPESVTGSFLSLTSEAEAAGMVVTRGHSTLDWTAQPMSRWRKWYHNASLGLWSFWMMLLALIPGTVQGFIISYLPTVTYALGATLDQSALLLAIMSAVDLVCRFLCGVIADTHVLAPSSLLAICQVGMGMSCIFLSFASSLPMLVVAVVIMGFFVGSRSPFIQLITLQVVGTEKMPPAYGLACMVATLFGASSNPVLSAVVEVTGSFSYALYIAGASFAVGGLLLWTIPVCIRLDTKHGRHQH